MLNYRTMYRMKGKKESLSSCLADVCDDIQSHHHTLINMPIHHNVTSRGRWMDGKRGKSPE